ncbi:MAG: hypothetical protein ACKOX6_00810 [Bdellovibrio sp.]
MSDYTRYKHFRIQRTLREQVRKDLEDVVNYPGIPQHVQRERIDAILKAYKDVSLEWPCLHDG